MSAMESKIFEGWIRHRRFKPKNHAFSYPIFMTWLNLDELEKVMTASKLWSLERFNLVSFFRKDYLGDSRLDLSMAVKNRIKEQTGHSFSGKICLLTHLRFLGFCFNPVSFYFCYPDGANQPRYILADINNTPWDERYCYVLDTRNSPPKDDKWTFIFDKVFHVSPFMPMELLYLWKFSLHGPNLTIHMELQQDNECCFDATLQLEAQDMTQKSMLTIPICYPFMTARVVFLIYWQALRLWVKGIPFFDHPQKQC